MVKIDNSDPMARFFEEERTAVFIDGSNLYATMRNLSFEVDFAKLRDFFAERADIVSFRYYTAMLEGEDYSPLKPLTDWLSYNGFQVLTKPAREFTDATGRRRVKGNLDIEIAVDMLELSAHVQHVVLFSGDSDFRRLVEAVQRKGVKVTVISSTQTQPSMIGDDLRRQANWFIELGDIADFFTRPFQQRNQDQPRRRTYEPIDAQ